MPKCEYCEIKGWGGRAYCHKKDDYVTDEFYYDFCNTYKYDDCPHYKGSSSGGCYLTTACVDVMGLADNCMELNVLRRFRDEYMSELPNGKAEIKEYYEKAPLIIEQIEKHGEGSVVFKSLYDNVIVPCVKHIQNGENELAHEKYKDMVHELDNKFL